VELESKTAGSTITKELKKANNAKLPQNVTKFGQTSYFCIPVNYKDCSKDRNTTLGTKERQKYQNFHI
jgi:hypothetical protein